MENTLNIIKALADGNRLRVVMTLVNVNELCVCQVTEMLGLATATVSRHMSVLQNAGLVASRKKGRWVYYRLADNFPDILLEWLQTTLVQSEAMKSDCCTLKNIVDCNLDELCRLQRERKGS